LSEFSRKVTNQSIIWVRDFFGTRLALKKRDAEVGDESAR